MGENEFIQGFDVTMDGLKSTGLKKRIILNRIFKKNGQEWARFIWLGIGKNDIKMITFFDRHEMRENFEQLTNWYLSKKNSAPCSTSNVMFRLKKRNVSENDFVSTMR